MYSGESGSVSRERGLYSGEGAGEGESYIGESGGSDPVLIIEAQIEKLDERNYGCKKTWRSKKDGSGKNKIFGSGRK